MTVVRFEARFSVKSGAPLDAALLTETFHKIIQRKSIADELLIDVADYSHVVDGPGVVLVAHEGIYGVELGSATRPATLSYAHRRSRAADSADALRYTLRHALGLAQLLQAEGKLAGKLEIDTQRWVLRLSDRLNAPNDEATFRALQPELLATLQPHFGAGLQLQSCGGEGEPLSVQVSAAEAKPVAALCKTLA
jgi:hypothetical protein